MKLFGKILKTGFDLVTTPVEIVKDVVTMGGACTDQSEPYTFKQIKRILKDTEEVREEIDSL